MCMVDWNTFSDFSFKPLLIVVSKTLIARNIYCLQIRLSLYKDNSFIHLFLFCMSYKI